MDEELLSQLTEAAIFRDGGAAGLAAGSGDEDPILRFFDSVRNATLSAMDRHPGMATLPTIFVYSASSARTDARRVNTSATRLIDLDLRSPAEWQGRLIFTAPHGYGGWAVDLPSGSVDEAFALLEQQGFEQTPVAVIYPDQRLLRCYQDGGVSERVPISLALPITARVVSIEDIMAVLEDVRHSSLLTPQIGPPGFWANAATYEPGPEAERTIQWIVAAQMRSLFRPLLVDTEQEIPLGRIDVLFTNPRPTPGSPLHPALVELKALKSRSNGGAAFAPSKNIKAVIKGMRQAKSYREEKHATYSVLACFDLRQTKNDILAEPLCRAARQKYFTDDRVRDVVLPVYASTEEAQEEVALH